MQRKIKGRNHGWSKEKDLKISDHVLFDSTSYYPRFRVKKLNLPTEALLNLSGNLTEIKTARKCLLFILQK
jgi:hypothetical protein